MCVPFEDSLRPCVKNKEQNQTKPNNNNKKNHCRVWRVNFSASVTRIQVRIWGNVPRFRVVKKKKKLRVASLLRLCRQCHEKDTQTGRPFPLQVTAGGFTLKQLPGRCSSWGDVACRLYTQDYKPQELGKSSLKVLLGLKKGKMFRSTFPVEIHCFISTVVCRTKTAQVSGSKKHRPGNLAWL